MAAILDLVMIILRIATFIIVIQAVMSLTRQFQCAEHSEPNRAQHLGRTSEHHRASLPPDPQHLAADGRTGPDANGRVAHHLLPRTRHRPLWLWRGAVLT